MKFILASQNRHKLVEMQSILSAHGVEVVLQGDLGLHVDCLLYTSPSPRDCS